MTSGIAQVHVKNIRGRLNVIAYGQSPLGKKVIKSLVPLETHSPTDENFKDELSRVVAELFA